MNRDEFIKSFSNKALLQAHNKIKKEKETYNRTGSYGTGRYVSSTEFYRGSHTTIKNELNRRKKEGLLSKNAGISKTQNTTMLNYGNFYQKPKKSIVGYFKF
jgi:hypothetical protein